MRRLLNAPIATILLGIGFGLIVAYRGTPALRHDWAWPRDRPGVFDLALVSISGWDPRGFGTPSAHLEDYLLGSGLAGLIWLVGAHAGLLLFLVLIGFTCANGAAAAARNAGCRGLGQTATALIALFNPWVYAKTVAGHLYMVLAYGACLALAAELLRRPTRPLVCALLVVLVLQQVQFILILLLVLTLAVRQPQVRLALVTAAILLLPVVVNLALEANSFRAVPLSLAWEASQSVDPHAAVLLLGYFPGYTQSIAWIDRWAMAAVVAVACSGLWSGRHGRWPLWLLVATLISVLLSMGLKGPLAPVVRTAFESWPPAAAFRELYDFLGLAAIGYVLGAALAFSRWPFVSVVGLAAGSAMMAVWLIWSPWMWWVEAKSLPRVHIAAPINTRYALLPAFQPLSMRSSGAGSGLDPDARLLPANVAPFNTETPDYPADAALARFLENGTPQSLEALSVSLIVIRPWLESDLEALSHQWALPVPRAWGSEGIAGAAHLGFGARPECQPDGTCALPLRAQPEVGLLPPPALCSVCQNLEADAVFFGDAAGHGTIFTITPTRDASKANVGWVDARLAFAVRPNLAQAFGGVITTSPDAVLPLRPGAALVYVEGKLLSTDGRVIVHDTRGYRWVAVPKYGGVHCHGLCVVAIQASNMPQAPPEQPSVSSTPLPARSWLPWLWTVNVEPGPPAVLRLNEAYDERWVALAHRTAFGHIRLDGVTNGWLLPRRQHRAQVLIVQETAAFSFGLELVALVWVMLLILRAWGKAFGHR